jgi:hypothetical protein
MSSEKTPMERAADALAKAGVQHAQLRDHYTERVVVALLDDPEFANRIRDWRLAPCEHSRPLRYGPVLGQSEPRYEQACSPCLRDRLTAHLLNGAA